MDNPEVISAIADCLVALFTLIGVCIAFAGLNAWRNQLHGTNEYKLARKILLQVYRLRETFRIVRNPFLSVAEADPEKNDMPWQISAYERRWETVKDAYAELSVSLLEAEVMWGDLLVTARSEIEDRKVDLQLATEMYMMSKQDESYKAYLKDYDDILYIKGSTDEYTEKVNDAIGQFESALKPYIARGPGWFRRVGRVLFGGL